jgi:hypothetical protein
MRGRRTIVAVAIVMGLMALAASLAPPPERTRPGPAPGPSPAPSAAPSVTAGDEVARTIRLGAARPEIRVQVGDTLGLTVAGDAVDTVVIPDLDVMEPIDPASPADIELYADTPGRYPISLLESGRPVGTLQITPAS